MTFHVLLVGAILLAIHVTRRQRERRRFDGMMRTLRTLAVEMPRVLGDAA